MMIQNKVKHHLNLEKESLRIKKIKMFKVRNQFNSQIILQFILYLKANLKMLQSLFHKYFLLAISLNKKNWKKKTARDFQKLEINLRLQVLLAKKNKHLAMNLLVTIHLIVMNKVKIKKRNKIVYKVISYWLNLNSKKRNNQQ